MCCPRGRSWPATACAISSLGAPRTTSTGSPSGCSCSCSGCGGRDDRLSHPQRHHVVPLRGSRAHHVLRSTSAAPRALDLPRRNRDLPSAVDPHLLGLRARGGRLPVLRGALLGAAAGHQLPARRGRHEHAHGAPHEHHHLRGRFRLLDGEGAQPGVLRAPPRPRHRRVRRVRLPRSLRALPLLRDRRASHVSLDRYLGLLGGDPTPGHLRLGLPPHRGGHQGIRGDEADPLPALRVGLHLGGHPCPLRGFGFHVFLLPGDGGHPVRARAPVLGLSRLLRGLRHPRGHLAAPHLVARRPCFRADRGVHAARGGAHEARRLWRGAAGAGTPPRRRQSVGVAGGGDRLREHRVRCAQRHGPDRSQVRHRLLVGVAHGRGHAGHGDADGKRAQRLGLPDVRPRHHDRPLLRPRGPRLREGALARHLLHGWIRPDDAGHRDRLHHRGPVLTGPARHRGFRGGVPHLPRGLAVAGLLVALPRRDRRLSHLRVRAARGQADLLGTEVHGSALPAPARCTGAGVGRPHHPCLHPGPLWRRPGHRPRPRGHCDGTAPHQTRSLSMMNGLGLELGLGVLILLVFFVGILSAGANRRRVGVLAALGLLVLLVLSFRIEPGTVLFGGTFVQDELAVFSKRLFLLATLLGVVGSLGLRAEPFARRATEYYVAMLASLLGMLVLASARELILLFVAFELMSIPLYVLSGFRKQEGESVEAALKFFLIGTVSSAFIVYGLSFVYGIAKTTDLSGVVTALQQGHPLLLLGMILTLGGLGFKIAAFPFHMWVPDTYEAASTPFVAWLSVAPKAAGFVVMFRLYLEGVGDPVLLWVPVAAGLAAITIVAGNLMAIPQQNVKRLLAYSGIAHIGYMLVGFAAVSADGVAMMLFYLVAYLFGNMGAFFVVEAV